MHVLLVKMSSMGDLIHTLPAITDAAKHIPDLQLDWVVEPAFAEIPAWHPAVKKIIKMPLRYWRKNMFRSFRSGEITTFLKDLREKEYDAIIDAQRLMKSAMVSRLAKGKIHGYDKHSSREPLSSYFYHHRYFIDTTQHVVARTRELFSKILQYDLPTTPPNFGIDPRRLPKLDFPLEKKYAVFLHGTTWPTKHYPDSYWRQLLEKTQADNITVYLPWGNPSEKNRAETLANGLNHVRVLPTLSLSQIAAVLKQATAVVTMDTGLGHLSTALNTPTISLYGPTASQEVAIQNHHHTILQANFPCSPCFSTTCVYAKKHHTEINPPCYTTIGPDTVWIYLRRLLHA